ncbi:Methyltransferase type 12 OS=Tsukamurella paurometabola (strain ATCC 8368 / DSM / CCUG 35730/ CIP 100753 / JCM 10117 / KCTC 9821 / NBRC 16120 / NCIMB 702349/ NCTC 13040) OX=521096 GN=Tpau_0435 PE=4 SV=1 [Tsukamurella paurometabola]|uniref:Methyltransferase type 12 n=1 Tax=Tsukamurella paurometabola (strain ATCC 8368 / DSM 20162 / CCUG 35730 / CIP 100753 / JCM 10117 / KCTC 9821 / NBRC 16120 / NCIMB 702349 / NCTC 13040) TaxID=521096 RepID=D5URM3_TSUPD|nr:methyltransferase domain-containing protein [Tsukamurella paurometabola]ADG77076.1 Methyltransferase type 12 [Tsukamurella paurometabola DSM 20162]SUP42687.1 Tellurite resistance protein TehB [Tsukamurella paurometabola]
MSTPDGAGPKHAAPDTVSPDGIDRADQEREEGTLGPLSPDALAREERQIRDAEAWDARYRSTDLVWGAPPDPWIVEQVTILPPGRALDVGAGEGRHALWLATRAWDVTAVDFSRVGLDKAATVAARQPRTVRARLHWTPLDVTVDEIPNSPYDLAIWAYVHPDAEQRAGAIARAAHALAPGGLLLLLAHERLEGHDGLPTFGAAEVSAALPEDMVVEHVEWRESDPHHGTGVDLAVRARRRWQ